LHKIAIRDIISKKSRGTVMIWIIVAVGMIILIKVAVIYCVAPGRMSIEAKKTAESFKGLNCAHRGLHTKDQKVPENSITAFKAAREGGYGVELDVQLSNDGQVIVFHDNDLKRVCGIDEKVNSKDRSELSALKLFETQDTIPLFSDVLEVLDDTPVIVELKSAGPDNVKLCEETLKILRKQGKNWCIESFDPRICAWFRKNAPDVLRGQLSNPPKDMTGISAVSKIMLGYLLTNFISRPHFIAYSNSPRPLTVLMCHALKPMKVIWTVHPTNDIKKCEKQNDVIIFEYYKPAPMFRTPQYDNIVVPFTIFYVVNQVHRPYDFHKKM